MEPLARRATADNPHAGWIPDRRSFLRAAGFAGMSWLTPVSQLLAQAAEQGPAASRPSRSSLSGWPAGPVSSKHSIRTPAP